MSKQPIIDPTGELARLRDDLIAFHKPVNALERFAVERIAFAQQSMLRAARLEASLFASAGDDLQAFLETAAFKVFLRYQAQSERLHRRAVEELMALQAQRPAVPAPQPAAPAARPQPLPTPAASAAPRTPAVIGNLALRI
jgi:hypothetical protein